jgi:hypothetical protein
MVHVKQDTPLLDDFYQPSVACVTHSEPSSSTVPVTHPIAESSSSPLDASLRRRSSAFVEVGLSGDDAILDAKLKSVESRPRMQVRFRSEIEVHELEEKNSAFDAGKESSFATHFAVTSFAFPSMPRIFLLTLLFALTLPSLHNSPFFNAGISPIGAEAGAIKTLLEPEIRTLPDELVGRDNSPVNICTRWSQQTAVVNGTLYIYGGRAKTQASQTSNTWSKSSALVLHAAY